MKLIVDGKELEVRDSITVTELLETAKVEMPQYVSVQVNEQFLPREEFDTTRLSEGDRVDFMYFMGGGKT